ncbi:hypothetical protein PspLS_01758 [Pyricularia sp. CBS 133598]|nr:hypothetical protein PspLS_01758 [Pyricularia sp. CBS 133598]
MKTFSLHVQREAKSRGKSAKLTRREKAKFGSHSSPAFEDFSIRSSKPIIASFYTLSDQAAV